MSAGVHVEILSFDHQGGGVDFSSPSELLTVHSCCKDLRPHKCLCLWQSEAVGAQSQNHCKTIPESGISSHYLSLRKQCSIWCVIEGTRV